MISLILWCIAPILNAMMDLVENENFTKSIFYRKLRSNIYSIDTDKKKEMWNNFWYKRESWKSAKKLFGYKFDAWHMIKSTMIMLIVASIITAHYYGIFFTCFKSQVLNILCEFISRGLWWNAIFSLFYNRLFIRKTWEK